MRIVVTGASGFVGRSFIRAAAAVGHDVVALSRSSASGPPGVTPVVLRDICDRGELATVFSGADAVVHLAARVHIMHHEGAAELDHYRAVNVEGTNAVIEAALSTGVGRAVFVSTAKVHGEGGGDTVYHDSDPLMPVGAYSESKAEAERVVGAVDPERLGWTILRPPLVYGAGVGGNFKRLLSLASFGARVPIPLGGVRNLRSLVFVENLVSALLTCLAHEGARGRRYLVSDGEAVSTATLLRRIGEARGQHVRLLNVPPRALRFGLAAIGRAAEAERLLDSFVIDGSGIRRELSWVPPFDLAAGLARTVPAARTASA